MKPVNNTFTTSFNRSNLDIEKGLQKSSQSDIVVYSNERTRFGKKIAYVFLFLLWVFSFVILMYDHIKYPDESPPEGIAILRDIFAIVIFIVTIVICLVCAYHICRYLCGNEKDQIMWIPIAGIMMYVLSGIFVFYCYVYYSKNNRAMPMVVQVLDIIALVYFMLVSLYVCPQFIIYIG